MMTDEADYPLLDRYLAGDCTPDERARLEQWMAADESRARLVTRMRALRDAVRASAAWDREAVRRELRERLAADGAPLAAPAPMSRDVPRDVPRFAFRAPDVSRHSRLRGALRFAAAASLVAAAAALVIRRGVIPEQRVATRVVRAERGQLTTVRLEDGSRVTLAPASTLDVPATFGERSRDVVLHGEGYFEVAHDPAHPFRVHSQNAVTRVVGTKFEVRAYPEDSAVSVVVAQGVVAVGVAQAGGESAGRAGTADGVVLEHGDRVRLDRRGSLRVEHGVNVAREIAWVRGQLTFVDRPLAQVIHEIERWYDVQVVVDDTALARTPVSASFTNDSLHEMLDAIALSLDARIEWDGRTAHLVAR